MLLLDQIRRSQRRLSKVYVCMHACMYSSDVHLCVNWLSYIYPCMHAYTHQYLLDVEYVAYANHIDMSLCRHGRSRAYSVCLPETWGAQPSDVASCPPAKP